MAEIFDEITSLGQCVRTEPFQDRTACSAACSACQNQNGVCFPEQKPVQYDQRMVFDRQHCEGLILNVKSPG